MQDVEHPVHGVRRTLQAAQTLQGSPRSGSILNRSRCQGELLDLSRGRTTVRTGRAVCLSAAWSIPGTGVNYYCLWNCVKCAMRCEMLLHPSCC